MNLIELYNMRGGVWWLQNYLRDYSPTMHQAAVLSNTSRKRLVTTNRRAGKSMLLCFDALEKAHNNPGFSIMMVSARDRQTNLLGDMICNLANRSSLPMTIQAPDRIVFPNGSVIFFRSGHQHVNRFYGYAADHCCVDDFESISFEVLQFLNDCSDIHGSSILMVGEPSGLRKVRERDTYSLLELASIRQAGAEYLARAAL